MKGKLLNCQIYAVMFALVKRILTTQLAKLDGVMHIVSYWIHPVLAILCVDSTMHKQGACTSYTTWADLRAFRTLTQTNTDLFRDNSSQD